LRYQFLNREVCPNAPGWATALHVGANPGYSTAEILRRAVLGAGRYPIVLNVETGEDGPLAPVWRPEEEGGPDSPAEFVREVSGWVDAIQDAYPDVRIFLTWPQIGKRAAQAYAADHKARMASFHNWLGRFAKSGNDPHGLIDRVLLAPMLYVVESGGHPALSFWTPAAVKFLQGYQKSLLPLVHTRKAVAAGQWVDMTDDELRAMFATARAWGLPDLAVWRDRDQSIAPERAALIDELTAAWAGRAD
jgi:hypothetical protein